jgi:uncharacterized protein (TIGR00369 family)
VTRTELNEILKASFPGRQHMPVVAEVHPDGVTVRLPFHPASLRPGNVISGPAMMMLADTAAYMALVAADTSALRAVTSHLDIHFLRKAEPGELVARGVVRKRGRRVSIVQVRVSREEVDVADAMVSYMTAEEPSS